VKPLSLYQAARFLYSFGTHALQASCAMHITEAAGGPRWGERTKGSGQNHKTQTLGNSRLPKYVSRNLQLIKFNKRRGDEECF